MEKIFILTSLDYVGFEPTSPALNRILPHRGPLSRVNSPLWRLGESNPFLHGANVSCWPIITKSPNKRKYSYAISAIQESNLANPKVTRLQRILTSSSMAGDILIVKCITHVMRQRTRQDSHLLRLVLQTNASTTSTSGPYYSFGNSCPPKRTTSSCCFALF